MTAVRDGGFYGWPYSYFEAYVDERMKPPRPDLVATALVPDYALGPHTTSLGLAASSGNRLPPAYANGMFVGQHGSWNRQPHSGNKVIFVPFEAGKPAGVPLDVLTGFLAADGSARCRPVGVALDTHGALSRPGADPALRCRRRPTATSAAGRAARPPCADTRRGLGRRHWRHRHRKHP